MIASSSHDSYEKNLFDVLETYDVNDDETAEKIKKIFENGGEGTFICKDSTKIDNLSAINFSGNEYVLIQAFPEKVTRRMIREENLIGTQLEIMMLALFVIYIISLIVRANREKKLLEEENREMGYIIDGVNTLFPRYSMVDFETDTYQYLQGTRPENKDVAVTGNYKDLIVYLSSIMIEEEERREFCSIMDKDAIIKAMAENNDMRFECHVMRRGHPEWEHVNIICLERKDGQVSKV